MSRILDMNRAVELGRIEQELYHKINHLDDSASVGLHLEFAERLMETLMSQFRLVYDGTARTISGDEVAVIIRRLDEIDELIDKIEQLRVQADRNN